MKIDEQKVIKYMQFTEQELWKMVSTGIYGTEKNALIYIMEALSRKKETQL